MELNKLRVQGFLCPSVFSRSKKSSLASYNFVEDFKAPSQSCKEVKKTFEKSIKRCHYLNNDLTFDWPQVDSIYDGG